MNQCELKFRGVTADGQVITGGGVYQSDGQLYIVAGFTFIAVKYAMRLVGHDERGHEIYKVVAESD